MKKIQWPKVLTEKSFKKRIWSYWTFWIVLVLAIYGTYEITKNIWIKGELAESMLIAQESREFAEAVRKYQNERLELYKNDTYGGKTPAETLKLYIEAVRAGDMELASKYYVIDVGEEFLEAFYALSDEEQKAGVKRLLNDYDTGNIKEVTYDGFTRIRILNKGGEIVFNTFVHFNEFTKVWKLRYF